MANVLDMFLGAASEPYNVGGGAQINYLAVGKRNTNFGSAIIHYSNDGITWTTNECVFIKNIPYDLVKSIWDGTKFIAVGDVTVASIDGYYWSYINDAAVGIAYNGTNKYVKCTNNGIVKISTDGINWTTVLPQSGSISPLPATWFGVIDGQGSAPASVYEIKEVEFIDGYFIISGSVIRNGPSGIFACRWISSDGINWIQDKLYYSGVVYGMAYNTVGSIATGLYSLMSEAPPGLQQSLAVTRLSSTYSGPAPTSPFPPLNIINSFTDDGYAATDGTTYVAILSPTTVAPVGFNYLSPPPVIYTSSLANPSVWTLRPYPGSANIRKLNRITYKSGTFYVVGTTITGTPILYRSNDGITWTSVSMYDGINNSEPIHITVR